MFKKVLWLAIAAYFTIFASVSAYKYLIFQYNLIDLAIFNQVFYNSTQGDLFALSIHPPSYLGDHFKPIILILLAPYYLLGLFFSNLNQPIALLIMQSAWLGLGAWPVFLIANKIFEDNISLGFWARGPSAFGGKTQANLKKYLPLGFALAYLLNPFIQNINLYEFHILPLAVPLLLFAFYFYLQKKFRLFLIFIILSLLIREDVSLVVFMFGVLAFFDRKKLGANYKKWVIWPLLLSVGYFLTATKIIAHFSVLGSYKYTVYYSWLTQNSPLEFLSHLISIFNLELFLGLLLPFAFLPLLKPKYLILALPTFAQILLGAPGGSGLILETHYVSLFLPALFIASFYGLNNLLTNPKLTSAKNIFSILLKIISKEKDILVIILVTAVLYSCLALGPGLTMAKNLINHQDYRENKLISQYFLKKIPKKAGVAASYSLLPALSSRPGLAPMHYVFMGKQQFGLNDYELPPDTQFILLDLNDFLDYHLQMPNSYLYHDFYEGGDNNLRKILKDFGLKETAGNLALFERGYQEKKPLYTVEKFSASESLGWVFPLRQKRTDAPLAQKPSLTKAEHAELNNLWRLELIFYNDQKLEEDYQFLVKILDKNKNPVEELLLPSAWGLYPTSEWQAGDLITSNYWLLLPEGLGEPELEIALVKIKGGNELDGWRAGERVIDKMEIINL